MSPIHAVADLQLSFNRIENRTDKMISIRQSGFGDNAWIKLEPLSTKKFAWEDPYGQKIVDAMVDSDSRNSIWKLDMEGTGISSAEDAELGLQFHVVEMGDVKVGRFTNYQGSTSREESMSLTPAGNWGTSHVQSAMQNAAAPIELIVELGVVGISVVDHRPKELSYMYLERVFVSYSTGYDGGSTSRYFS
jgi:vacuolar protein sorting-associated protein 13A/C